MTSQCKQLTTSGDLIKHQVSGKSKVVDAENVRSAPPEEVLDKVRLNYEPLASSAK